MLRLNKENVINSCFDKEPFELYFSDEIKIYEIIMKLWIMKLKYKIKIMKLMK